jgi:hypothetical protein
MNLYDIGILSFCIIMFCLIFISVSKNILTEYGVGLLIAGLVLGIIGYNIWIDFQVWELLRKIYSSFLKNE